MQHYDQYGQPIPRSSTPSNWGSVAVGLATIVMGIIGAKSSQFEWLLYLCAPLLLISVLLMLWQTPIKTFLVSRWLSCKDRRILASYLNEYKKLVESCEVAEKLFRAVFDLDWPQEKRLPVYRHPEGYSRGLLEVSKNLKSGAPVEFLHLNNSVCRHLEHIDSYLNQCDHRVVDRTVRFRCESEKTKLHKLIREYEDFLKKHNDFCKTVNSNMTAHTIYPFYGTDLCYSPKELVYSDAEV